MKNKDLQTRILAQAVYNLMQESKGKESEKVVANFIAYLTQHHLLSLLPNILAELKKLHQTALGVIAVEVDSAHNLADASLKEIEKYISRKLDSKVELVTKENKNLLGGIVLNYQDKQIDLSLKNKLNRLFKQLAN